MAMMTEQGVLYYGDNSIHYDVRRTANSTSRKVTIKVHPDQRVVATAPHDATSEAIHKAMLKQVRWIWRNLTDFAKQTETVLPKRYVSGETQFYLGRRYVLKVLIDPSQPQSVKLGRGKLNINLQHEASNKAEKIKPLIDHWYRQKARAVFQERLNELLLKTTWVTNTPSFRIMSMTRQWGSCSTQGNLVFNPHLVKAPKECIDYVILHELCHIAEHNHSERFWRLLTQVMPHWKDVKARLDGMAEMYLNE